MTFLYDSGEGPRHIAIMSLPSQRIVTDCEVTHKRREPIRFATLMQQFWRYVSLIQSHGVRVIVDRFLPNNPDGVFIEDSFKVFHEVAVLFPMGVDSRRCEPAAFEGILRQFRRNVRRISGDGVNIEGGDVYWIGKDVFVGLRRDGTARTNEAGFQALGEILEPLGYRMHRVFLKDPSRNGVKYKGALHLTTGSSVVRRDPGAVLINTDWVEPDAFDNAGVQILEAPKEEPFGANCKILSDGHLISQGGSRRTHLVLQRNSLSHTPVSLTEFRKAEGSPTCCVGGVFTLNGAH